MTVPPRLRREVSNRAMRLRTAITKATRYRIQEDVAAETKIKLLQGDIKNAPSHVFGEHGRCKEIAYFKCNPTAEESNLVPEMKGCGLYSDIEACLQRLVNNVCSLIFNMDNNLAEHFNSIICKFVGGKRVNFALRGSYETRCEAAALSYNLNGDYHRNLHKAFTGISPKAFKQSYISRIKKRKLQVKKILFRKKRSAAALPDQDYGPNANVISLSVDEDEYKRKEALFLTHLKKNKTEIMDIERATVGQSGNPIWIQERSVRITASYFGQICKMRPTTPCTNTVKNLLYSKFTGNQATRYGIENEPLAIQAFQDKYNLEVESCGLFIDEENCFLGASPDGLINGDALIEIKCPSLISKISPEQGIFEKKIKFAELTENYALHLKRNHNYYYQVQGQLAVTKRKYCYFCIWSPHGLLVEVVCQNMVKVSMYTYCNFIFFLLLL